VRMLSYPETIRAVCTVQRFWEEEDDINSDQVG